MYATRHAQKQEDELAPSWVPLATHQQPSSRQTFLSKRTVREKSDVEKQHTIYIINIQIHTYIPTHMHTHT